LKVRLELTQVKTLTKVHSTDKLQPWPQYIRLGWK
jgi:hypothetical protein